MIVTLGFGDLKANFKMGLVNLGEAGVDHLFVEFLLLFEPEDFSRLFGENAGDRVENGIVIIRIESRNDVDLKLIRFGEIEGRFEAGEGEVASIDRHDDLSHFSRLGRLRLFDDENIRLADPANRSLGDASDHALLTAPTPRAPRITRS